MGKLAKISAAQTEPTRLIKAPNLDDNAISTTAKINGAKLALERPETRSAIKIATATLKIVPVVVRRAEKRKDFMTAGSHHGVYTFANSPRCLSLTGDFHKNAMDPKSHRENRKLIRALLLHLF